MYRAGEKVSSDFDKIVDYKTSMRSLKVGVYETYKEAEVRAKALQRHDQNFHVFRNGKVSFRDPEADKIQSEEYLNEELNTLIKEYKKNQVHKDMLYEQEKEERQRDQMKKKIAEEELAKQEKDNAKASFTAENNLEQDDPAKAKSSATNEN